jgi:ribonuclease G
MHEEILIDVTLPETRVAILQEGAVQELHTERTLNRKQAGNLYLGRVSRVLPGVQAAFVDIGLERTAFLHANDIWHPRSPSRTSVIPSSDSSDSSDDSNVPPIEKVLSEGQSIIVQVIKDPIGTKGARLSTQISLAGHTLVYFPQEAGIGISQKIVDDAKREALRAHFANLIAGKSGGFIVRTLAEHASDEALSNDICYLQKLWADICTRAQRASAPALLHRNLGLAERVLRDFVSEHTHRIQVGTHEAFLALEEFSKKFVPHLQTKLFDASQLDSSHASLFERYAIEEEIRHALEKRVVLQCGGYLIIDQTEAMTTVDVNTGSYVGARYAEDTIFQTNLEAARALARQLRLRNLGGVIIVDFIDMENIAHRESVLSALRSALAGDRARSSVGNFSPLGLVEITRKRTHESLAHELCQACPTCQGTGLIKTPRTVCYEILRHLPRLAGHAPSRTLCIVASQPVIDLLREESFTHLTMASRTLGRSITLRADEQLHPSDYDIVTM